MIYPRGGEACGRTTTQLKSIFVLNPCFKLYSVNQNGFDGYCFIHAKDMHGILSNYAFLNSLLYKFDFWYKFDRY